MAPTRFWIEQHRAELARLERGELAARRPVSQVCDPGLVARAMARFWPHGRIPHVAGPLQRDRPRRSA